MILEELHKEALKMLITAMDDGMITLNIHAISEYRWTVGAIKGQHQWFISFQIDSSIRIYKNREAIPRACFYKSYEFKEWLSDILELH